MLEKPLQQNDLIKPLLVINKTWIILNMAPKHELNGRSPKIPRISWAEHPEIYARSTFDATRSSEEGSAPVPYLELLGLDEQVLGDGEGLGEQLGGVEHLPADLLRRGREPPDCLRDELLVGHDGRIRGRRDVEVARGRRRERGAGGHGGLQPRHRRLQPLH